MKIKKKNSSIYTGLTQFCGTNALDCLHNLVISSQLPLMIKIGDVIFGRYVVVTLWAGQKWFMRKYCFCFSLLSWKTKVTYLVHVFTKLKGPESLSSEKPRNKP